MAEKNPKETAAKSTATKKPETEPKPTAKTASATAEKTAAKSANSAKPKTTDKAESSTANAAAKKTAKETTAKSAATEKTASVAKTTAKAKSETKEKSETASKTATKSASSAVEKQTAKKTTSEKPKAASKADSSENTAKTVTSAKSEKIAAKEETKSSVKAESSDNSEKAETSTKRSRSKTSETSATEISAATIYEPSKSESGRSLVADSAAPESDSDIKIKEKKAKTSNSSFGASVAALFKNKKSRMIIMGVIAAILLVTIIIGIVVGTRPRGPIGPAAGIIVDNKQVIGDKPPLLVNNSGKPVLAPADDVTQGETFNKEYATTTAVGFSSKILDANYERKQSIAYKPGSSELRTNEGEVFGNAKYPKFGYTLSDVIGSGDDKKAARQKLIEESDYYCALGTRNNSGNGNNGDGTYSWMDENGMLWNGTRTAPVQAINADGTPRQLYKHDTAAGMYFGGYNNTDDLLDSEPGISKQVTIRPRGYGSYSVTGVYAPAGEIIKIEMSEEDMNATGGITIHIGQALYNGQSNNIWADKGQMQRFPNILNTMNVNKNTAKLENGVYTAYVGSFIGGPLYIRNTNATFTATISGGVAYSHFILGYTTPEEFEQNKKSSAPYFDLEVWNYGVLHSGPKIYSQNFSYDELYKVAVLWEKISSVTTTGSNQGIVFLYEPFVAAGAAVAFPGRSSVNCPTGWMSNSLNYNTMVSSGAWGNLHEYHHNFQNYGVGNGGEVTNNGMTLVSYALFTKISSKRGMSGFGSEGLGGWNNYTSATLALEETFKIARPDQSPSNGNQGLALYATLLHNFGANNYIQAKYRQQKGGYGQTYTGYLRAWQELTHNDMTYFFKDILQGITDDAAKEITEKWGNPDYSMFVPVSSVYQTGRSYMYDGQKKYFTTMQPYVIPYGEKFNIDLSRYSAPNGQYESGSIVIPEGFDYKIKSISKPQNGTLTLIDNYHFEYTPNTNMRSGQIIVTLEITKKDKAFKVDDVDLILEFEQSHETNKMTLTRNTYSYSAETMYADAQTAYEKSYAGYTNTVTSDHKNPVQNSNTDIWFYPNDEANHTKYPDAPDSFFVQDNTVIELNGKLYFDEAGKYRIYLRGRTNCALYLSTDGGATYFFAAAVKNGNSSQFYPGNPDTYKDIELKEHSWVYFKEVLIVQSKPQVSFIGLGMSKWTDPMFTIVTKYYDAEGNEVPEGSPDAVSEKIHYYDYQGHEVTEEEANKAEKIPPASNKQPSYINAYRHNYEFPTNSDFETDYFYKRNYNYTYSATADGLSQSIVDSKGSDTVDFPISNLIDGDSSTMCSSAGPVSASSPWEITVDLGKVIEANRFELTGNKFHNANNKNQTPNSITLYLGKTLDDMREIMSFDKGNVNNITLAFNFDTTSFRYYKLVVRGTPEGRYAAIREIKFSNVISNGMQFTPDDEAFAFSKDWKVQPTFSTFGHVFVGNANATMSFKFSGSRLAILSSTLYGQSFEVYIDGKKVNSIELKKQHGESVASFISEKLANDTHTVQIKCTGKANIDSIVIFDEN